MSQKTESRPPPRQFNFIPKIINGGIAGIVGVVCVFPLDLVKTRLQNQQFGPNGEKMYTSILDCFRKTIKSEGFFGMYRGSFVNILLITPEKAIKLSSNDYFRFILTPENGILSLFRQVVAGGSAGAFQIIITTPMELLKIQMQDAGRIAAKAQLTGEAFQRPTAIQVTKMLMREKGIFGLYKGLGATALRDVTFSMYFFPLFATLNDLGPRKSDGSGQAVFWCSFLSGLGAGSISALAVTPFDVVKTRLQAIKKAEGEREFDGIIDCIRKTYKYEGLRAFFKGGLCRMMVIAPLFGVSQTVYFLGIGEAIAGLFRSK